MQYPAPSDRPTVQLITLYDPQKEMWRPGVVCFPAVGSFAVVHTAEDYSRHLKTKTERGLRSQIEPIARDWTESPPVVRKMVHKARRGAYDDEAETAGYESPISYVMGLLEDFAEGDVIPALEHHGRDLMITDKGFLKEEVAA